MTSEEAIEALRLINLKSVHPFLSWEEMKEVRDVAIDALQKQSPSIPLPDNHEDHMGLKCPSCGKRLDWTEYVSKKKKALVMKAKNMLDENTLEQAVDKLRAEFEKAKANDMVRNPMAYALYQVWKKYDEKLRKEDE